MGVEVRVLTWETEFYLKKLFYCEQLLEKLDSQKNILEKQNLQLHKQYKVRLFSDIPLTLKLGDNLIPGVKNFGRIQTSRNQSSTSEQCQ